jgi:signal transduction histidine kinase/DNA-binding LytR/AlgR family response regulator
MGALVRLREAFSRLIRTGTQGVSDPRQAKRIIIANQIASSMVVLCFLHVYIDSAMGAKLLGWLNIPNGLVFFGIVLLNRAGRSWAARFLLINYSSLIILMYFLALGKGTGMHLFFLPACWASLVLFGWDERKSLLYGMFLNSFLLIACELGGSERGLLYSLHLEVAARMHSDTVITTLVIQTLIAAYFTIGNHRAETALGEAVKAAKSADRSKTRFLANMSHEIRTPLNGVLGITRLLIKSGLPPGKREMAQTIESSSQDLMAILNEILDLSKVEAGKMELENRPFDLHAAWSVALRPYEYEAQRKGLYLRLERDDALPAWVSGDSVRFKQVLRNLMGNAFKFTSEGGITVRIRAAERPGWLDFEVEDTGPGIPEDARGRIFQSFTQADDSTARKFGGTGLGLAICKQIVELMGGAIGFRDRTARGTEGGPGTVFYFTAPFPAASPPEESGSADDGKARQAEGTFRENLAARASGLRCLIVDDHFVNRQVLEGMLEEFRIRADMAEGGQQALDACAGRTSDLVFTDCHMPGMDGMEFTRRLRNRNASGSPPVRIVGVTADVMSGTREQCLEAGMDEILSKPVLEEDLERILAKLLPQVPGLPAARPADPGPAPDWTWVDSDRLTTLLKSIPSRSPDRWEQVLASLRADMEAQLRAARSSLENDDRDGGKDAAHGLKGLCLTMGLSRMAESCLYLERSLSEGIPKDWVATVGSLEAALEPSLLELSSLAIAFEGQRVA